MCREVERMSKIVNETFTDTNGFTWEKCQTVPKQKYTYFWTICPNCDECHKEVWGGQVVKCDCGLKFIVEDD